MAYYIKNAWFETVEDDWENGETGPTCSSWTAGDIGINRNIGYQKVSDALAYVCQKCYFAFNKKNWENACDCDMDDCSRFYTDFLVDNDNTEATPDQIENWKNKRLRLYNCHAVVELEVHDEPRGLTESEAANWD